MDDARDPTLQRPFAPHEVTRPAPVLLRYYFFVSLFLGPLFFAAFIPLYFKYHTLRYRFDDRGVSMSWGILFRREVLLTYRRIQDIHLTRNIVQRWLGLASVSVQTAAGSSTAEMSIEGVLEAEPLRDFLYGQMRGAHGLEGPHGSLESTAGTPPDEAVALLREIRDALARRSQVRGGES